MQHSRREPAEGVFRLVLPLPFPGLNRVNAYLLADDAGAILVDCGIHDPAPERDHGWADLEEALASCDVTPGDVTRLVVTHPHIDHYGMAGTVLARTGCEFWMHGLADAELEMYRDPEAGAQKLRGMLADHGVSEEELDELAAFEDWRPFVSDVVDASKWLRGGETFSAGDRTWSIVHTPGHSAAHICLWSEQGKLLISGDHLLPSITPHIDFRRGDEDPLGEFLASLEKIEDLAPELVLPGHGRPFEDGAVRARVTIRHHDRRLGSILQVIRKAPRTASEITDEIFGTTLLHFQRRLALGEALAHLAHLRKSGEVERIEGPDGRFLYRKAARTRSDDDDD
jgi:glyoxylase-like metal-dependent hydrolase (beta-lactamase superfamily II)